MVLSRLGVYFLSFHPIYSRKGCSIAVVVERRGTRLFIVGVPDISPGSVHIAFSALTVAISCHGGRCFALLGFDLVDTTIA